MKDVEKYSAAVERNIGVEQTDNQLVALTSLCFNIGVSGFAHSTLVKRINQQASRELIDANFLAWNSKGKLMTRRKKELALYWSEV